MTLESIKYALRGIIHRKLRSWLMVLSILIGITAIFTLISFGLGIQNYVNTVAEDAGTDKLFIQGKGIGAPGTDENFFITKEDVEVVDKIKGVEKVAGVYIKVAEIEHKKEKKNNFLVGVDASDEKFMKETLFVDTVSGRNLKKGDVTKVALGFNYQIENKIFKNALNVGDKIKVNSHPVEILGFYEEVGNPADDANIYMTYEGFESIFPDSKNKFGYTLVKAAPGEDVSQLTDRIEDKLRKFKGQEEGKEDFFVQTFEDLLATFGAVIIIINAVLILIALVSVVVASVNIMNTMYTSVLERTKEIGVMKAIGAQNKDILLIFVFESGLLGLVGGALGIILGYIISTLGGKIAANAGFALLQPVFPWFLIVGSLLFAGSVGAAAGLLPAKQASQLKPVDALRYE
jgi:putative ABC transport system permease protein